MDLALLGAKSLVLCERRIKVVRAWIGEGSLFSLCLSVSLSVSLSLSLTNTTLHVCGQHYADGCGVISI